MIEITVIVKVKVICDVKWTVIGLGSIPAPSLGKKVVFFSEGVGFS